eukprot:COSAG01_NODE_10874_length_2064_cov_2.511450_1_plen_81_part_00
MMIVSPCLGSRVHSGSIIAHLVLRLRDRAEQEAVELAREHGPSNSCCDFLEHCRRYGATWRGVIEWVGELLVNLTLGAAY